MNANDNMQFEILADILKDIGKHLKAIEFETYKLKNFYGIQVAEVGVQCGKNIHLYSGIELVEMALRKVAIEEYGNYPKKTMHHNGIQIFQLATPSVNEYRKAECGAWEVISHEKP